MIKEEIKLIKETPADLRKFGLTVGIVLILISAILFFNESSLYIYFTIIGFLLALAGLIFPTILKPLNKIWMILAIVLGFIMTRVILSILFYLVLTPIGLIAKIAGKKFLILKPDKSLNTYWEKREKKVFNSVDYERQF